MEDKRIITGIDVGTTKIAVVIAECTMEKNQIRILGVGEAPSNGLKKGVIVNMEETIESLSLALSEAENQADIAIDQAFVGITGDHIRGINYSGVITISKGRNHHPVGHIDRLYIFQHFLSLQIVFISKYQHVIRWAKRKIYCLHHHGISG